MVPGQACVSGPITGAWVFSKGALKRQEMTPFQREREYSAAALVGMGEDELDVTQSPYNLFDLY